MINKPSVFSRIKVSSPLIESLKKDLKQERTSFIESLTADQMAKAFPPNANLGSNKAGAPITPKAVAMQANTVPLAQTQNGTKIMTDPKTGQLIIVSDDPNAVQVQTPEDTAKLQQLALLAQQTQMQQATAPTAQQTTAQQTVATQKAAQQAAQQQATRRVNEADEMAEFIQSLGQLLPQYTQSGQVVEDEPTETTTEETVKEVNEGDGTAETDSEMGANTGSSEVPEEHAPTTENIPDTPASPTGAPAEVEEEENDTPFNPVANDGLVQVNQAHDNMIDPTDAIKALGDTFWTPPSANLKGAVASAQQNIGLNGGPVEEEEPHGLMPRRNMAQYVKTGLNQMPGMPGNVIGNDFDDIMGIESPYAIKLALSIGK